MRSPLGWGQDVFRLDFQAVAVHVHDPNAIADGGGCAARRPLAVTDADAAAVAVNRFGYDHHAPKKACRRVIKHGMGGVVIAGRIGPLPAHACNEDREDGENPELHGND